MLTLTTADELLSLENMSVLQHSAFEVRVALEDLAP